MLSYGFIGLGQVGGQMCDIAKSKGYEALALNTAMIDLNTLDTLSPSEKFHLSGYEGAGKDRSIGLDAFTAHEQKIESRLQERFRDTHILFPIAALGGGTGSGMIAAFCTMLCSLFPHAIISPIVFLPSKQESPRPKMNALESFSALSEIEELGAMFVLDNNHILERFRALPLQEKYEQAQHEFFDLLQKWNRCTEKESKLGNLDRMDLLTVFSERGAAIFSEFGFTDEHVKEPRLLGERLAKSWRLSLFADSDTSHIAKAAISLSVPASFMTHLTADSIFDKLGKPLEVFSSLYDTPNEEPLLLSFITGLPFPTLRLQELEQEIQKEEERITHTIAQARSQKFVVKTSWTSNLKRERKFKI